MGKIVTLKDLAERPDEEIKEYGQKAEGLVELIRANKGEYIVDPGFGIPCSFNLGAGAELKKPLYGLLLGGGGPRLLIARSSDPEEAPGVFESHTFMFSPGQYKQCHQDLVEAVEKVRASGARAVVCQRMAAGLEEIAYDYDYDSVAMEEKISTKPCFGAERIGFVYNSWSPYFEETPVIATAFGLVSKIVGSKDQKDWEREDISLIFDRQRGLHVVNLGARYDSRSHASYEQQILDVVFPDNPKAVISFKSARPLKGGVIYTAHAETTFDPQNFGPGDLFNILNKLKIDGREIEVEGDIKQDDFSMDGMKPHLFQLRRYDLPKRRLKKLTKVNGQRILMNSEAMFSAADSFSGDMVVLDKMGPWPSWNGQIVAVPDYNSILYGWKNRERTRDFVRAAIERKVKSLVIPAKVLPKRGGNTALHELGLTVQELWALQKDLPVIAMDPQSLFTLKSFREEFKTKWPDRVLRKPYGTVYLNVTVESNSSDGQIYFN